MGAYNYNKVPVKLPIKEIHISLNWSDGIGTAGKTFGDVQGFANFLKDNPELGKAIGYVPKNRKA